MVKPVIENIFDTIESKLKLMQIELVDIEYKKENSEQILRIIIDSPDGVDLSTCAEASRVVKNIIDQAEIYYDHLQVASPGLDRALKRDQDFSRFQGQRILIKTLKTYAGPRKITGLLRGFSSECIEVEIDGDIQKIPREMITVVHLHPEY